MKLWHILAILAATGAGAWFFFFREKPDTSGKQATAGSAPVGKKKKGVVKKLVPNPQHEGSQLPAEGAAVASIGMKPNKRDTRPAKLGGLMSGATFMKLHNTDPSISQQVQAYNAANAPFVRQGAGGVHASAFKAGLAQAGVQVTAVRETDTAPAGGKLGPQLVR
jgi:hypothetical protein